jgi:tetratricopeptide (TPR) repeat protein
MLRSRRSFVLLVSLTVLVSLAAGACAWWKTVSDPDARLKRGLDALQSGDSKMAEHLMWLLEAGDHKDHARLLRAHLLFQEAKPLLDAHQVKSVEHVLKSCLTELNKIRDQAALRIQASALSGQCLLYLDDNAKAENALNFVLKQDPDHIDAHRGLAALYYNQGASLLAVAHLQEVARLDPHDARPHRFMGSIYKGLEQYSLAIPCYEAALDRQLSDNAAHEARIELAECLVKNLNFDRAWLLLERETDSTADQVALRGECLAGMARTAEAQVMLDRGLKEYPLSVKLLEQRAKLYQDAHQSKEAAALLERAIKIDPGDYACSYLLAQVYESLDLPAQAAEKRRISEQIRGYLVEMTRLNNEATNNPWDASTRRRIAEICVKLGRPDQANLWLQAAAACAPVQTETGQVSPAKN